MSFIFSRINKQTRHENLQEADRRRQRFGQSAPALLGKPIVYHSVRSS